VSTCPTPRIGSGIAPGWARHSWPPYSRRQRMHLRQKSPVVSAYHRCTSRIHEGNKRDASIFLSVRCVRELGRPHSARGDPQALPALRLVHTSVTQMVDPCGQPPVAEKWMRSAERLLKIRGEYGQAAMSSAKRASSLTSMAPPGLTSAEWCQRARHVRRSNVSSKPSSAAAKRQVGICQEACREDEAGEEPFVPNRSGGR
jgi:hypothetical protein